MIREGFVYNTATSPSNPTFSGSQFLNEQQMTAMADENTSIAAVTVSATENIHLTADLGARWKITRIELYTDDPSNNNIDMQISDNDVDYYPVTMTGSPNLYVGDIMDSTISGAPRYVRYNHAAASDLDVFEWKVINDDSLVDFGADGTQTEVEIEDAPIGRPSDTVQNLKLFNQYHKPGAAFVFIEDTGTAADELFEISTSSIGPWFGREVTESLQPHNTPWVSGTLDGTRLVTASGYYLNWYEYQNGMSWTPTNILFDSWQADPEASTGGFLRWITTGVNPNYRSPSDYTQGLTPWATVTAGVGNINAPHLRNILVDTDLYDTVRVRMRVDPLNLDDIVEGPRIRWRWIDDADGSDPFPIENSSLSQFAFNNFTGETQDFIFNVSEITTWSGAPFHQIRGLQIDPFITATGIGVNWDLYEVEVYHSSRQDKIVLDHQPTQSGIKPSLIDAFGSTDGGHHVWLFPNTRVLRPCIITKVMAVTSAPSSSNTGGIFLYEEDKDSGNYNWPGMPPVDNPFPNPPTPGGAAGDNFIVKGTCQFRTMNGENESLNEHWVFWRADPGDMIGISRESQNSGWGVNYRVTGGAPNPGAWYAPNINQYGNNAVDMESNAVCQADLNTNDSWRHFDSRLYEVWYQTVPLGDYLANGTYTTPVFDGGVEPSLVSSSFVAIEPRGSKLDSNTSEAFKTLRARASDSPPVTSAEIGEPFNYENFNWGHEYRQRYPDGQLPTGDGTKPVRKWINEETAAPAGNDWMINHINGFVTNREFPSGGNAIKNLAGSMMYHPVKDELWVMNVLASGIQPNEIRPVWDVYNPDSLEYIRTDHMKGQLNYTYRADNYGSQPETFEPAGFIYDAAYNEIHVYQRENSFYIDTVTYYAVTMDTEGNFLRCSFRNGSIGGSGTRWNNINSMTFDGSYFYALTTNNNNVDHSYGDILSVIKRGDLQTGDNTIISEIASIDLSTIPGLEGADANPKTQQIIYNSNDGLLYLFFGDPINSGDDPRYRNPEVYALDISIDSNDVVQSIAKVELEDPRNLSTIGGVRLPELGQKRDGYAGDWAGYNAPNDDTVLIAARNLEFFTASCHDPVRDVFYIISSHQGEAWNDHDLRENWRRTNNYLYDHKTIQKFFSCHGGALGLSYGDTPIVPRGSDPRWGALSGTIGWDSLQQNSVLFPTGRYAQVEYTLNSSPDFSTTPQLITSQLDQGIRVGDIPASGTTDIYLRTNLPEGMAIGDLQGGLKVFWELPE
jgi:hypothetical protein